MFVHFHLLSLKLVSRLLFSGDTFKFCNPLKRFFKKMRGIVDMLCVSIFYARQLYQQILLRARIIYGDSVRPSIRLSVCPFGVSRPYTESSPGQIETLGFHRMIA